MVDDDNLITAMDFTLVLGCKWYIFLKCSLGFYLTNKPVLMLQNLTSKDL